MASELVNSEVEKRNLLSPSKSNRWAVHIKKVPAKLGYI